jgi:hypothetical protein
MAFAITRLRKALRTTGRLLLLTETEDVGQLVLAADVGLWVLAELDRARMAAGTDFYTTGGPESPL